VTVTAIDQRPTYELESVNRWYGRSGVSVRALSDVDLTIDRGSFVAVVGPSGSGKTTLLQLLGGLDRPTEGQVVFEGRDLSRLSDRELSELRRDAFGFVFQQFNLIPTLTAAQNVEVALAPGKLSGGERAKRTAALLDRVGLGQRGDHLPSQLSGGEQQRVAIARALANDPRVLLADEPTGNLDSATGHEIVSLLRTLNEDHARTIILITHDSSVAASAERTIRLRDGQIVDENRSVAETAR
jgi:ABC-type lipoprotein export system ATPase subunit